MYISEYIHIYIYMCAFIYIYIYIYTYIHTLVYMYIYTYTYIHVYSHIYSHTHTYIHIYILPHICIHIYICFRRVKGLSCGAYHTGALLYCGALYTWGSGGDGELGHGNTENQLTPLEVRVIRRVTHECVTYKRVMSHVRYIYVEL